MIHKIEHLPKEKWQGVVLPMDYTTQYYYDVVQQSNHSSFSFSLEKKQFSSPRVHRAKDYNYPDKLYEPYLEHPYAWGIVQEGNLIAAIETDKEIWSNRLRITELWVDEKYQRQGIGKALMNIAKEQARKERCRAIILETQSCNINAIDFYLYCGFHLAGLDTCCYHNDDISRKEVRLEFAWYLPK